MISTALHGVAATGVVASGDRPGMTWIPASPTTLAVVGAAVPAAAVPAVAIPAVAIPANAAHAAGAHDMRKRRAAAATVASVTRGPI
ncbi:hypothetical protein [Mycolicibacterium grossiae]|uniref:Uncharacterized protein n=1 Tax=Mycolicibacterium grossiae TaxID=1552759 RepID=A0A1E8PZH9_9MYCO|nr:hypothetical protein [Mycolicibacterium grossiae]OFJ51189.1 hypothetical protein BEL07_24045 [Mycolicibacterium grossiae]QEM45666.1 hypothetical protein FZ046_13590 [Mycolicibacterium grossiae]